MKKFMKICGITAAILIVAGLLITVVTGVSLSGDKIKEVVEDATDGKVDVNLTSPTNWNITLGKHQYGSSQGNFLNSHHSDESSHHSSTSLGGGEFDIEDKIVFHADREVYSGTVDKMDLGCDVLNLDVQVGGCKLELAESSDTHFYAEAANAGKLQIFVEGETLCVYTVQKGVTFSIHAADNPSIKIYIPRDHMFKDVSIALGAGETLAKDLLASDIALNVGAGHIRIDNITSNTLKVEVGMGEVELYGAVIGELEAEVGMGALKADANIYTRAELEVAMGEIDLKLAGKETDFNYRLEGAAGSVTLAGEHFSGISHEKRIDNGAAADIIAEAAMGSINISFH